MTRVTAIADNVPHDCRSYRSIFRFARQKNCFDAVVQRAVCISDRFLVLKIADVSDSS